FVFCFFLFFCIYFFYFLYVCCFLFFFFFYSSVHHRDLHSFPTRRSSDLPQSAIRNGCVMITPTHYMLLSAALFMIGVIGVVDHRSEEHTSELQSPYDLVCRLLLEKKKKKKKRITKETKKHNIVHTIKLQY